MVVAFYQSIQSSGVIVPEPVTRGRAPSKVSCICLSPTFVPIPSLPLECPSDDEL
jgi:hypothetical protein